MDPRQIIAFSYGLSWLVLGGSTLAVAAVLKWRRKRRRVNAATREHLKRRG